MVQLKDLTGVLFRSEAMRLFEADCPRQLMTEMGLLAQRRRREDKKAEQVGKYCLGSLTTHDKR